MAPQTRKRAQQPIDSALQPPKKSRKTSTQGAHPQKKPAATKPADPSAEDQAAAEVVLQHLSVSDLQAITRKQMQDPVIRASVVAKLLSLADTAAARAQGLAQEICKTIQAAAKKDIQRVYEQVREHKGCESSRAWPDALFKHLPDVEDLLDRGPVANGPENAWTVLLYLADLCILPETDGGFRFQEGEETCDEFHDMVDELMLRVCQAQKKAGKSEWLNGERTRELMKLADDAGQVYVGHRMKCSEYRYSRTLKFLKKKR